MFRSAEEWRLIQERNAQNWAIARRNLKIFGTMILLIAGAATIGLWWLYFQVPG